MPKLPELRRSNRDRHPVYQSLQENSIGIPLGSALFNSLVNEAKRVQLLSGRYHTRSRRNYEYEDSYSNTPKSGDISDPNDENVPHSNRLRPSRRRTFVSFEEYDDIDEPVRPKRTHRSLPAAREEPQLDLENAEEDNQSEGGEFSSLSERVKRRRARTSDEPSQKKRKPLNRHRRSAGHADYQESQDAAEDGNDECSAEVRADQKELLAEQEEQDSLLEDEAESQNVDVQMDDGRPYFLRRNRTQVNRLQDEYASHQHLRRSTRLNNSHFARPRESHSHTSSRRPKRYRGRSSSSSTSSSDSDDMATKDLKAEAKFERRKLKSLRKGRANFLPVNMNAAEWKHRQQLNSLLSQHDNNPLQGAGDIEPMAVDKNVGFVDVGGLESHVQSLKEIVAFPLQYPEIFQKFNMSAPKGVLFYGPPGTGKTLVARALANECSKEGNKVTFFMRKGADCLSKWVGESERQLRLLFDQAYQMRPSIIFFDEIDGLAPVRSSRQDQIHSSIVSTLLALMDGLDSRGQVVVIGATNRPDSIDPAFRRPGRFDRELRFDLPDKHARRTILEIHTKKWEGERPSEGTLDDLANKTSGYCGADLKALCAEAVLVALRNRYPHIYLCQQKLALDPNSIRVQSHHFDEALRRIIPASRRGFTLSSFTVDPRLDVFLEPVVADILLKVPDGYIAAKPLPSNDLERVVEGLKIPPVVPKKCVLLTADGDIGQSRYHINSLVRRLDHLLLFSISYDQIFTNSQPEENLSATMLSITQATARGARALLILPELDVMEQNLPPSVWHMLLSALRGFDGFVPLLIVATVSTNYDCISDSLKSIFRSRESVPVPLPRDAERRAFFSGILEPATDPPNVFDAARYPAPQKAKIDNACTMKLSDVELATLKESYGQMLRQQRIFLRDILGRLMRDRRYHYFISPVNKEDAEDYYEIITNPMCLAKMTAKIDQDEYKTPADFLEDIDLIRKNALEYNPLQDAAIRHNANSLLDTASTLFDIELDKSFESKLRETRRILAESELRLQGKPVDEPAPQADEEEPEWKPEVQEANEDTQTSSEGTPNLVVDRAELDGVCDKAVVRTDGWLVRDIEALGVELTQVVQSFAGVWDRSKLPSRLRRTIDQFEA